MFSQVFTVLAMSRNWIWSVKNYNDFKVTLGFYGAPNINLSFPQNRTCKVIHQNTMNS